MSVPEVTGHESASPFDRIRQIRLDGSEFWSARDLQQVMNYTRWSGFKIPLERAMKAAENQGHDVTSHFQGSAKVVERPQGGGSAHEDFHLTRFAAYLVAMNGDPNKAQVAEAQAYFAVQTRVAETKPALAGADLFAHAVLEAKAMIEERDRTIASQGEQISQLAPKAAYVDEFVADDDLLSVRTVASTVGMQEGQLRDLLVSKKWIYRETTTRWSDTQGRKIPVNRYSEYADKKPYFRRVEQHDVPRFRGEVMHTLKITPPGAAAIARLVNRTGGNVIDLFEGGE